MTRNVPLAPALWGVKPGCCTALGTRQAADATSQTEGTVTSTEPLDRNATQPWWRRVVPLSVAVLLVAAVAVALVPPLREQFVLSASHREASYVEMAFTQDENGLVHPCMSAKGAVAIRFALAAHGDAAGGRSWRVRLSDPAGARSPQRLEGVARLPVDTPVGVRRTVRWSGPYDLVVTLPGTTQRLVAHCGRAS